MEETVPIAFPSVDPTKYVVSIHENEIKNFHISMMLGFEEYAQYFRDKYWIYGINVNPQPLASLTTR